MTARAGTGLTRSAFGLFAASAVFASSVESRVVAQEAAARRAPEAARNFAFSLDTGAIGRVRQLFPMRLLLEAQHSALRNAYLATRDADAVERALVGHWTGALAAKLTSSFLSDAVQDVRCEFRDKDARDRFVELLRAPIVKESALRSIVDSPLVTRRWQRESKALYTALRGRTASLLLASNSDPERPIVPLRPMRRSRGVSKGAPLESWISLASAPWLPSPAFASVRIDSSVLAASSPSAARGSLETIRVSHAALKAGVFDGEDARLDELARILPHDCVLAMRARFVRDFDLAARMRGVAALLESDVANAIVEGLAHSPLAQSGSLPTDVAVLAFRPGAAVALPEPAIAFRIGDAPCEERAVLASIEASLRAAISRRPVVPVVEDPDKPEEETSPKSLTVSRNARRTDPHGKAGPSKIRLLGRGEDAVPYLRMADLVTDSDELFALKLILGGGSLSAVRTGPWFVLACNPRTARSLKRGKKPKLAQRLRDFGAAPKDAVPMEMWLNLAVVAEKSTSLTEIIGPILVTTVSLVRNLIGPALGVQGVPFDPRLMTPKPFRALLADCGQERIFALKHDAASGTIEFSRRGSGVLSPAAWNLAAQCWHALQVHRALRDD